MFSLLRFMNIDFLETKNKELDYTFSKIDCLLSLNILYIISLTLLGLELTWKRMKKNSRDTEFHENGDNPNFDFSYLDFWSLFIMKIFNRSVNKFTILARYRKYIGTYLTWMRITRLENWNLSNNQIRLETFFPLRWKSTERKLIKVRQ